MESDLPKKSTIELSIAFISDKEMRELNREFRKKDKPTDVLSFPMLEGAGPVTGMLGDVVISLDTAKKQAASLGVTLKNEILRLLVHGILHLLGYDHENVSRREAKRMFDKEKEIMECVLDEAKSLVL